MQTSCCLQCYWNGGQLIPSWPHRMLTLSVIWVHGRQPPVLWGVGFRLQELLKEESPGSICSCHNCSLEYVKSQHLASSRHWSYDKQVLEYRKSLFAATVILNQKNTSQNTRHLTNCLLRPCAALCNRTYSRTCLTSSLWVPDKIVCDNAVHEMLWFSLRCHRLLQGCHMMPQGARVVAATRWWLICRSEVETTADRPWRLECSVLYALGGRQTSYRKQMQVSQTHLRPGMRFCIANCHICSDVFQEEAKGSFAVAVKKWMTLS